MMHKSHGYLKRIGLWHPLSQSILLQDECLHRGAREDGLPHPPNGQEIKPLGGQGI